jgi:multiple sugar transport system substrate-binding protein
MTHRSIIFALLVSAACAGCHRNGGPGPLTVSLFSDLDGVTIMSKHLAGFEAESGIKVQPVYIPYANYNDKLVTQVAAGSAPDVIWVDVTEFPALRHLGAFVPLDPFLAEDPIDLKAHFSQAVARFTEEGHLWAVPQDIAPIACVYYNKSAFKEAGLAMPRGDWDWAGFLAVCKRLVKKGPDGRVIRYAFMDDYGPDWSGIIYSNGGVLVDNVDHPSRCLLDLPADIQAVQFLADLALKYGVSPDPGARNSMLALGQDEFISGRVAMLRCGIWITPALRAIKDFDWDIVAFPSGPQAKGGKGGWGTGGSGFAISSSCKRPQEAWALLKYLSRESSQAAYIPTGIFMPSLKKLAASEAFLKSSPPANKAWLIGAVSRSVFNPADPRWNEADQSIISPAMMEIMAGRASAQASLPVVAKKVDQLLFSSTNP